jgi:hypothetical protein
MWRGLLRLWRRSQIHAADVLVGQPANSVAEKTTTAGPCRATTKCILSLGFPCRPLLGPASL